METSQRRSSAIVCAIVAAAAIAVTFLTDKRIFVFPPAGEDRYLLAMTDYHICKVIAFALLFVLLYRISEMIFGKGRSAGDLAGIIKCAAAYLPVIIVVLVIKLPEGFLSNDEYAISENAVRLVHDTWFNVITVYYYIVSFMLIPVKLAPIIVKVIIQVFVAGYSVWRTGRVYGKKGGLIMYILFLLYPVIAYTTSAHRLPVYFLIYLAMFEKLLFDRLEGSRISAAGAAGLLLAGAVLTQWRTEGIYLLFLVPILMFIVYPDLRNKKAAIWLLAGYMLFQYAVYIPQNGISSSNLSDAANDRMKPFYAYIITNMYRNGLDMRANEEDLARVDEYISIDAIKAINEHYGDINYEDVLILIDTSFEGVREGASYAQYYDFTQAVKNIMINNPGVFMATRWKAFCYSAMPYHISFTSSSPRDLLSFAVSVVKTVSYNLFIPVGFAVALCLYSLIRRRWYTFFVAGGLIAHTAIVFVLAPASYFKYYFPVYIMSYFYMILIIIRFIVKGEGRYPDPVI